MRGLPFLLVSLCLAAAGCSSADFEVASADAATIDSAGADIGSDTAPVDTAIDSGTGDTPADVGADTCDGTRCGSECIDLDTNATHCGSCTNVCKTGDTCVKGVCRGCDPGKTRCGLLCVDTSTDGSNCGGCGKSCPTDTKCLAGFCTAPSTKVTFPSAGSTTYSMYIAGTPPLGAGGGGSHFTSGDYVQETFGRTAVVTALDLDFMMSDATHDTGCPVGTLSWAVKLNGITVGTYSWTGGKGGDKSVKQTYTFAGITPLSTVTIRLEATSTVCPGGGSWNWYPGGTAVLR